MVSPLHCNQAGLFLDKKLLRVIGIFGRRRCQISFPPMHGT